PFGDVAHRFGVEHARAHPRRNGEAGPRRTALVRGEKRVLVELAPHLRHPVLVDDVRRRNSQHALEGCPELLPAEVHRGALGATGVHRATPRGELESNPLAVAALEPGMEEERRAEEKQGLSSLLRALELLARALPAGLAALDDPGPARAELPHHVIRHEPE